MTDTEAMLHEQLNEMTNRYEDACGDAEAAAQDVADLRAQLAACEDELANVQQARDALHDLVQPVAAALEGALNELIEGDSLVDYDQWQQLLEMCKRTGLLGGQGQPPQPAAATPPSKSYADTFHPSGGGGGQP